jgi:hypothetical protein
MPTNRHTGSAQQAHVMSLPFGAHPLAKEPPVVLALGPEVLVPNPMT